MIDGESTTCLLDNGAQLNFMTPAYALKQGFNIMSLDCLVKEAGGQQLPPINGLGGLFVKPVGFVLVNVQVPCVRGYNEGQIMIILDDPNMTDCPVILGKPMLFRVMQVIKESKITKLATPWASLCLSWLFGNVSACMAQLPLTNLANNSITPTSISQVVRVSNRIQIPPSGHKITHGKTGLILQGYKINVMTHGLQQRSPQLPLGIDVLSCYATLTTGSN